jgi:hypothetical protein
MQFREMITVHCEHHKKQINTLCQESTVFNGEAGGAYSRNYCALNSQKHADVPYQCILPQNKESNNQSHFSQRVNVYIDMVHVKLLDLRV